MHCLRFLFLAQLLVWYLKVETMQVTKLFS